MKRKRFMRLLMAHGVQRNEAARMARGVGAFGSYAAFYESLRPWLAFKSLKMATIRAAAGIRAIGRAFNEAMQGFKGFRFGVDLANGVDFAAYHHPRPQNRIDAIDALTYSAQYMSREKHAAAHKLDGYRAGAVLVDETPFEGSGNNAE